jgi:hypothetical protein
MRSICRLLVLAGLGLFCAIAQATAPEPFAFHQSMNAGSPAQRMGERMAMEGGLLAVGLPRADVPGCGSVCERNGKVFVYRWFPGMGWWRIFVFDQTSFGQSGPTADARFGAGVAVSGNRVLIGCPGCAGAARAFLVDVSGNIDTKGQPFDAYWAITPPPGLTTLDDPAHGIGSAVALAGIIVAIGAPRATFGIIEFGAVAVGRFDGAQMQWEEVFYGWEGSRFGQSLALESTRVSTLVTNHALLVGAPQYVQQGVFGIAGRAQLFSRSFNGAWSSGQEFENPDPSLADGLGTAVAIWRPSAANDGYIALGAPGRIDQNIASGKVRLYRREPSDSEFVFDDEVGLPAPAAADRFGGSLALIGPRVLVGADGREVDLASNAGSAYVFDRRFVFPTGWVWPLQQTLIPRPAGNGDAFGSAVAMAEWGAAVSAPLDNIGSDADAGSVYAYVCDRIFRHGMDDDSLAETCATPALPP